MVKRNKISHRSMRRGNILLILEVVKKFGPLSRADISRRTGLTKSTVSEIVSFLLERGLIKETGVSEKSGAGRKGILVDLNDEILVIGYDVGTIYSKVVLSDVKGRVLRKKVFKTQKDGEITDQIEREVLEIAEGVWNRVVEVGFGFPGMVDHSGGRIVHSPNLDLRDFDFSGVFSRIFPKKRVTVDHNVKLMMIAESEYGDLEGAANVLLINMGPGVGAAFMMDGRLVRGFHNFSGEIGHLGVVERGYRCKCGKVGCLETVAAAWGIVERYEEISGKRIDDPYDSEEVARRARDGDETALKVFETAGRYLGKAVALAVNILDPELVLLSGGLSRSWDLMERGFIEEFDENVIIPLRDKVRIKVSRLGDFSTAIGAVSVAIDDFLKSSVS